MRDVSATTRIEVFILVGSDPDPKGSNSRSIITPVLKFKKIYSL